MGSPVSMKLDVVAFLPSPRLGVLCVAKDVKRFDSCGAPGLVLSQVHITGKYGVRYGASLRKQIKKIEVTQHAKYTCGCE